MMKYLSIAVILLMIIPDIAAEQRSHKLEKHPEYIGFYRERSTLVCEVKIGDKIGRGFTISGMEQDTIRLIWHDDGEFDSLAKTNDNERVISFVQTATLSGSVQAIVINKEMGFFSLVQAHATSFTDETLASTFSSIGICI